MPLLDARPPGVDLLFRPGNGITVVLVWPDGSLTGRTFTSTLGADDLDVTKDDDTLTIVATAEQTEDLNRPADWALLEGGEAVIVGRWTPSDSNAVESAEYEVTVVEGDATVAVTVVGVEVSGGGGGGGAPTDATYLVTTSNGDLSAEVVVGATPGGELGGTWASPTVDASHSGSSHASTQAAAEATAAAALASHEADTTNVHGIANTANVIESGDAAGGVLGGTYPNPSFAADMATQAELDAEAALARNADNLTSGTVADARIASTIARDSEVAAGYQPLDPDLTAIAALTTTAFGRGLLELANAAALLSAAGAQASDADLTAIAALTTTSYGRAFLELANQAALMALLSAGSESAQGILELATTAEATTGTDTARAVTAAGVKAHVDARALLLAAGGANVENVGAIESDVQTVATTGATETLDTSEYAVFDMTMDQNCTFTFSNPAPSGDNSTFMLILRGSFTPTFPASVDWPDATPPTYTTPSVYIFTTVDAGTTWLGASVGKAFA